MGDAWVQYAQLIFDRFSMVPREKRVSIHEFFLALICCSKGTVSEKAATELGLQNFQCWHLPLTSELPELAG